MTSEKDNRKDGCLAVTPERKYYGRHGVFIKWTSDPKNISPATEASTFPLAKERLMNAAETLRYIRENSGIPCVHSRLCSHSTARSGSNEDT
jgi:hypothetical protein